jgi:hypothetical protein
MIQTFQKSNYVRHIAVLLAFSMLTMSFTPNKPDDVVLNAGTIVALETTSMLQSDQVFVGQTIDFRVKYDVKVNGKKAIVAGSIAKGQIMRAQKAKGLGRQGFLEVQIKSVTAVDGQEVFLSGGNVYQEGDDKQALAIALGVFVCILFLTIKGKNAQVPAGYQVSSSVATSMNLQL